MISIEYIAFALYMLLIAGLVAYGLLVGPSVFDVKMAENVMIVAGVLVLISIVYCERKRKKEAEENDSKKEDNKTAEEEELQDVRY